ncbi:MAG: NADH-quinone oxidoreductase subunit NuoE [Magnetococcus sp. DMHC-6]
MSGLQPEKSHTTPQFSDEALREIESIYKKYPENRRQSALMPILYLAQKEFGGWLSSEVLAYVAKIMEIPPARVYEVATFYTMYNLKPVGKYHIQVCTNISCWLCDSDAIMKALIEKLQINPGENSTDGKFTLKEVECLGACVNAPMMQINDDYHEDLTPEKVSEIIARLP